MPGSAAADLGLGAASSLLDQEDMARGVINSLKTGIQRADGVSTVSPMYAREICDTPLGMGLQGALHGRADRVTGILNGVDYQEWDPRFDPHLSAHFAPQDLRGKLINKEMLIATLQLKLSTTQPLIGMVTRCGREQKGIDLLFDSLPWDSCRCATSGWSCLAAGNPSIGLLRLARTAFPDRVSYRSGPR